MVGVGIEANGAGDKTAPEMDGEGGGNAADDDDDDDAALKA